MPPPPDEKPATLRSIAKAIGVSHVTVSLALRNNPKLPAPRRQQIQAVAEQMGYRPNASATTLGHQRHASSASSSIKAALAWINQYPEPRRLRGFLEFDRYWQGAHAAAEKFGYRLEEFRCDRKMSLARIEKILLTRRIRGILLPPHPPGTRWDGLNWEYFSGMRFGRSIPHPGFHIVTSDQVANAMKAFREITARGYRRIGFVTGRGSQRGHLYKAGFLMAQSEADAASQIPICVLNEDAPPASHRDELARWLEIYRADAIVTDVKETRNLLQSIDVRVPEDIGLAALSVLDGNADAGIDQHPEEIGRVAVLLTISLINDNALGIPPIFRQALVAGSWIDGKTLPDRLAGAAGSTNHPSS